MDESGSRRQTERLAEKRQVRTTKASPGTMGKRSSLRQKRTDALGGGKDKKDITSRARNLRIKSQIKEM